MSGTVLIKHVDLRLDGMSDTRWSDRVQSIKPFVAHLLGIIMVLEELLELNLTPKCSGHVKDVVSYVTLFICNIMSVARHEVLVPIDFCYTIIQARYACHLRCQVV